MPVPARPRAKPHVAFVPLDDENLLVKGPGLFLRYSGEAVPLLRRMLPLLDGTRDADEVAAALGAPVSDVRDVLEGLAADKLLEDAAHDEELRGGEAERARRAPQMRIWSHLTANPARAQNRVAAAKVLVAGGGALADEAARVLAEAGVGEVRRGDDPRGADHVLVALDALDAPTLLTWNERLLAARAPWTAAFLDGLEASVGPTVLPGQTACWRCYDLRVKGAHPNLERLLLYEAAASRAPPAPALPSFARIAGASAAQAVLLTLAGAGAPPLAGHVQRLEFLEMRAERHRVLRIPRCPACSPADVPDVDRYALDPVRLS